MEAQQNAQRTSVILGTVPIRIMAMPTRLPRCRDRVTYSELLVKFLAIEVAVQPSRVR